MHAFVAACTRKCGGVYAKVKRTPFHPGVAATLAATLASILSAVIAFPVGSDGLLQDAIKGGVAEAAVTQPGRSRCRSHYRGE